MPSFSPIAKVRFSELLEAFEFANFGGDFEHGAYIDPDSGRIYYVSPGYEMEEEVPEDIESSDRYIAIPHKNDLNLGRNLVLSFAEKELPGDYGTIAGFFRKRGAYARFKDFLASHSLLDRWYDFEASEKEKALRAWCKDHDIAIIDEQPVA
ncbi:MAG: UPF0158 family protein [Gammaproteobacteria bacterium]|nr:UPF0158 family protein [Gammaproteobacteria bacterium]MBU1481584.1 UPF0158 family protein [Gammaproteobacteria bacterium]